MCTLSQPTDFGSFSVIIKDKTRISLLALLCNIVLEVVSDIIDKKGNRGKLEGRREELSLFPNTTV